MARERVEVLDAIPNRAASHLLKTQRWSKWRQTEEPNHLVHRVVEPRDEVPLVLNRQARMASEPLPFRDAVALDEGEELFDAPRLEHERRDDLVVAVVAREVPALRAEGRLQRHERREEILALEVDDAQVRPCREVVARGRSGLLARVTEEELEPDRIDPVAPTVDSRQVLCAVDTVAVRLVRRSRLHRARLGVEREQLSVHARPGMLLERIDEQRRPRASVPDHDERNHRRIILGAMAAGYQDRDRHLIDYEMVELPGVAPHVGGGRFRGPRVVGSEYIACLGGAQVFGRYCKTPFPVLLGRRLGIETMNLGWGGAGPTFYTSSAPLLDYVNRARLAVVLVMSARAQSSSAFVQTHHNLRGIRQLDGKVMTAPEFFQELVENEPERVPAIVEETKRTFVDEMTRLLGSIRVPKILFWFSVRQPRFTGEVALPLTRLWGEFPQLVDDGMVERLRARADEYVECVTSRGLPHAIVDRAGLAAVAAHKVGIAHAEPEPSAMNVYYPSPEMHEDAASALEGACRRWLR